ncbi:unnamed protein product [Gadus morhua 'NCC']
MNFHNSAENSSVICSLWEQEEVEEHQTALDWETELSWTGDCSRPGWAGLSFRKSLINRPFQGREEGEVGPLLRSTLAPPPSLLRRPAVPHRVRPSDHGRPRPPLPAGPLGPPSLPGPELRRGGGGPRVEP